MTTITDLQRLVRKDTNAVQALETRGLNQFLSSGSDIQTGLRSIESTANQVGLQEAVTEARGQASTSFDVGENVLERRQRGLGLRLTDRQRTAQKRRLGLGRAVAEAGAGSAVRRDFRRRATAAASAAGSLEAGLRDLEFAGLEGLANAEGQEKIRRANERANKKAATAGLISSIVGMGMSFISSEDVKYDKRPIETEGSLLNRLKKVRVEKWKYIGEDTDHIGPYAEEFNDTFDVGKDNKGMISLVDALGVLMGSVKELDAKVEARG